MKDKSMSVRRLENSPHLNRRAKSVTELALSVRQPLDDMTWRAFRDRTKLVRKGATIFRVDKQGHVVEAVTPATGFTHTTNPTDAQHLYDKLT